MSSAKKIESNRRNAQKSTGPKTERGKSRTRLNALKHGFCSAAILPGESPSRCLRLQREIFESYGPVGVQEEFYANLIVREIWRLERIDRAENHALRKLIKHQCWRRREPYADRHGRVRGRVRICDVDEALSNYLSSRMETPDRIERYRQDVQRTLHRSVLMLLALQERRLKAEQLLIENKPNDLTEE